MKIYKVVFNDYRKSCSESCSKEVFYYHTRKAAKAKFNQYKLGIKEYGKRFSSFDAYYSESPCAFSINVLTSIVPLKDNDICLHSCNFQ